MIKNNLLVALRNFRKHKAITSINVLGLSIGISAALVIFLIIQYEYSFDKWVPERENIYRVYTHVQGGSNPGLCVPGQNAITQGVPGVDIAAPVIIAPFGNKYTVDIPGAKTGDVKRFPKNNELSFADGNYFKIFPRQWIAGNPNTALSQVGQVVLTLSEAGKYFPQNAPEAVIGKQMTFQDSIQTLVTGIIADLKENTDLRSNIFISLKTYTETNLGKSFMQPAWRNVNGNDQLFIKLNANTSGATVDKLVENLFVQNQKDIDLKDRWIGKLQPLSDIHFNTTIDGKTSKTTLRNLALLAVLLLLLAVINFINLSTAQSTLRAKEIGVRKTFGGSKKQIIYQFLTEAFLITGLATLLAVMLTPVLIYVFRDFIPHELNAGRLLQPVAAVFLAGLLLIVSLLAGLYPAFVLSGFRPVLVLKNNIVADGKPRGIWVRQVLTVFQFVIAQVFLIVVFVIGKQIHFELNKDIGLRKEGIISVSIPDFPKQGASKGFVLANESRGIPQIQNVSLNTSTPISQGYSSTRIIWYNNGAEETYSDIHVRSADENYIDVFGLQLLAGKNIRVDTSAKVQDVLINESMLHKMNLHNPHNAIGQFIKGGPADSAQIVGVVKDFNTMSFHNPIYPTTIFANKDSWIPVLSIAFAGNDAAGWKKAIDKTEALFQKMYPGQEFDYSFLNDTVRKLYEADIRLSTLLKWATGLALFISCLGLLGLVSFIANRKVKEIGIRKVLGASAVQIIILLSGNLVRLIAVACIISFPLAWYFSHKWLQNFTFRINISWWIFLISAAGILAVAIVVLCLRSIRAAATNPAKSLRSE
ncbi:MAG: ABC transporter permease [Niabella sp.]